MAKFFNKSQQQHSAKTGVVSGSEAIDDYLKAIFQLSGREERQVSSTEIAGTLAITAASVTNMLQKLASLEPPLVLYEKHRGVQLSKAGKKRALEIIRRATKTTEEELRPTDNLELDLGFDSMQRVELLVALEKELGGDVEESILAEIYSARELVDAVLESAAAGTAVSRSRGQPAGWKSILQEESTDVEVLGLARPGNLPGGAEVVRRMASHELQRIP